VCESETDARSRPVSGHRTQIPVELKDPVPLPRAYLRLYYDGYIYTVTVRSNPFFKVCKTSLSTTTCDTGSVL